MSTSHTLKGSNSSPATMPAGFTELEVIPKPTTKTTHTTHTVSPLVNYS